MAEMYMIIETVTPAKARKYLETNTSNRRIRKHFVKFLARAILNGQLTGRR